MHRINTIINHYRPVCLFSGILIAVIFGAPETSAATNELPFSPGEKLVFELKWTIIPAGEATLEVKAIEDINGISAYHFVLTARSNSFVDVFYKVRDHIDAYAEIKMTRSLLYIKKQHEGNTKRDVQVIFNWDNNTAQYFNFGKLEKTISIMPGSFDPLSVFYYSRLLGLKEGAQITRPVTDGKKCVVGRAKILKRERISLRSGTYDAFLLEPELRHIGGVFEKSENAKIQLWVSADDRRLPLKIKSKVVVGSFVGELVSIENAAVPLK